MITSFLLRYYARMQARHPGALWRGDASRREIALTFDDGPHPKDTAQVLEMLTKHNVRTTFFLIGKHVEQYLHLVKQIHQSGHQLGIHCYRHIPFPFEKPSTLCAQLDRTRNAIAEACGISTDTIRDVRPPYGLFTAKILSMLSEWKYRLVLWDNMPLHFLQPTQWTIKQVLERTVPGSVIVLHDGKGHGSKVAQIVDTILPKLKASNFKFVTTENMERMKVHES